MKKNFKLFILTLIVISSVFMLSSCDLMSELLYYANYGESLFNTFFMKDVDVPPVVTDNTDSDETPNVDVLPDSDEVLDIEEDIEDDHEIDKDMETDTIITVGDYIFVLLTNNTYKIIDYIGDDSNITLPTTVNDLPVTSIGSYSMTLSAFVSLVIPSSIINVGCYAFMYSEELISITLSEGVKVLGEGAFYNCTALENVSIPSSVTTIYDYVFRDCDSLSEITVDEENADYSSLDGVLFDKSKTTLIKYPSQIADNNYLVPNTVSEISSWSFYGSLNLFTVTLSNNLINIDDAAFRCCYNIESIIIPSGVTRIGATAFACCESLKNITLPDTLVEIDIGAFEACTELESIIIPDSVTVINSYAFCNCYKLADINISMNITILDDSVFRNCYELTEIVLPDSVSCINYYAFAGCTNLESITITRPLCNGLIECRSYALDDCNDALKVYVPSNCVDAYKAFWSDYSDLICEKV